MRRSFEPLKVQRPVLLTFEHFLKPSNLRDNFVIVTSLKVSLNQTQISSPYDVTKLLCQLS